jgi:NADH dehydrogenase/NADH:ubiquinone oxidoreductase subunit G
VIHGIQILEAARAAGLFVPTLCAHPSIRARGLCRVCLVEIEGQSKLQPACVTAVKEGLKVRTNTPAVLESVRFVLQLLRAKHPDACATCDANNNCTFQDLIYRFEVRGGEEACTTDPPPPPAPSLSTHTAGALLRLEPAHTHTHPLRRWRTSRRRG